MVIIAYSKRITKKKSVVHKKGEYWNRLAVGACSVVV